MWYVSGVLNFFVVLNSVLYLKFKKKKTVFIAETTEEDNGS